MRKITLEEVRPIPGLDGYYATTEGRILTDYLWGSKKKTRTTELREIRPAKERHGYLRACLRLNGERVYYRVHELVLLTFVGVRPEGHVCRHGKLGSTNHSLKNLSYGTQSQNMLEDRLRDGTIVRGEDVWNAKLTREKVLAIRERLKTGEKQKDIAGEFNIAQSTLCSIKKRRVWAWL